MITEVSTCFTAEILNTDGAVVLIWYNNLRNSSPAHAEAVLDKVVKYKSFNCNKRNRMNDERRTLLKQCSINDLETLRKLSMETYETAFRSFTTDEIMQAYLQDAFSPEKLGTELSNPASAFYFLYADDKLAGYFKINVAAAQTDIRDPASIELERIYVLEIFRGMGLGSFLMQCVIDTALAYEKDYIWLGVWEKNEKAIDFYRRHGFEVVGSHPFYMGSEKQDDYIMRKNLFYEP